MNVFVTRALATLIHEEFHAINEVGWQGVVFEQFTRTPALTQLREGIVDAGVEVFLPDLLPDLGLAGLKPALRLLEFRRVYVAQKVAVRRLLDYAEGLVKRPSRELLRMAIKQGSGLVALRNLAHEIARAKALPNRAPDSGWSVRQIWLSPDTAEARIVQEILRPFETLANLSAHREGESVQDVVQRGVDTGDAVVRGLERSLDKAA